MCLDLIAILTGQGHIREICVISETSKSNVDIFLEVIPFETEVFCHDFNTVAAVNE